MGDTGKIYFYGTGPDQTEGLYTGHSQYRLVLDRSKVRKAQVQPRRVITGGFSPHYVEQVKAEDDQLYVMDSESGDPWLEQVLSSEAGIPRGYVHQMDLELDILVEEPMRVEFGLGRSSGLNAVDGDGDGIQDAEHQLRGVVLSQGNVVTISEETASEVGAGLWDVGFEFPGGIGLSDVDASAPGLQARIGGLFSTGPGYALSEIQVDTISISYARPYVSKLGDDHLQFAGPNDGESGYQVLIPKHGKVKVFASDGTNLVKINPQNKTTITNADGVDRTQIEFAALQATGLSVLPTRYWVSNEQGYLGVEGLVSKPVMSQAALVDQVAGSNYLLVTHPAFMGLDTNGVDHLSTYADFKRSEGYTVSIVNYLDVVDSFGGGQAGPEGLTRYLKAVENTHGQLEHVLLVGGSVYDHRDYQGAGALTFIPGYYINSVYTRYTVSDEPYIRDEGGGYIASIGRWPVREMSDLAHIVDTSIRWASADRSSGGDALLIAENILEGEGINFAQALDGVADGLPSNYSQTKVYVDEILAANPGMSDAEAIIQGRSEIIQQLNTHPDVVMYNGHASSRQLSNQTLYKWTNVALTQPGGAQVWLPMSCYVTYYESTHVNTLAHQLLFKGNAVNITGAMLLSSQGANVIMGEGILDGVFNQGFTLGEAVNQAKTQLVNPGITGNWSFLGDPTTSLTPQ